MKTKPECKHVKIHENRINKTHEIPQINWVCVVCGEEGSDFYYSTAVLNIDYHTIKEKFKNKPDVTEPKKNNANSLY